MLTRKHIQRLAELTEEYDAELRVLQTKAEKLLAELAHQRAAMSKLEDTYADKMDRAAPGWRDYVTEKYFESVDPGV